MALFGSTPPPTSRLEELKRILQRDPTSRQFLALAEEYRRHGKLRDAIITLERGLAVHSSAVAAHVALGRIYQQLDRFDDAIRSFTNALRIDRENLVAIRQLAEVHLARGERLDALKKLKLFRGLNAGDREVDELILRLETELAPPPQRFPPARAEGAGPVGPAPPSPFASAARSGATVPPMPAPRPAPEPVYRPPPPVAPELPVEAAPAEPAWEMPAAAPRWAEEPLPSAAVDPEERTFTPEETVFETEILASPEPAEAPEESPHIVEEEPPEEPAPALFAASPVLSLPPEPLTIPMTVLETSPEVPDGIPVRETLSGESPLPEVDPESPTAPLVTETLAGLYRSQGYVADAGEVYRTLAASAPDSEAAREFEKKADELAREASGPRARLRKFLAHFPARRPVTLDELSTVLSDVATGIPGLSVAALTDREGLAVVTRGASRNGGATEILVAELTAFFRSVGRSGTEVGGGPLKSLSLVTEKGTAVLSRVSADYSLILKAEPGAALGEVRWAADRAAARLGPALG
jgi:predicted regulator of Ras-like GTPase activity (Roadblock/LC7/MglB family)